MAKKTKAQLEAEIAELQKALGEAQPARRVLVGVRIPEDLRDQIKDASHEDGREIQDIYAEALRNWVRARQRRMDRQAEQK